MNTVTFRGYFASNQRQCCFAYFVTWQMGGTRFLGNLVQAGTDKTVILRTCNLGRLRRDRSFVWRHLAVSGSIYCRRGAILLLEELDEM